MRFLLDMGLGRRTAEFLRHRGHDAIHLRDQGLQRFLDQRDRQRSQGSPVAGWEVSTVTVKTEILRLHTQGHADMHDLTRPVQEAVRRSGLQAGIVTVFCPSSTSALTTIEYESGALADLQRLLDELAPADQPYQHNLRWGDGNGHSHLRAALLGPSLTIPFVAGRLTLGTWQQILYIDFDNRPRQRELVVQVMGE